MGEVAERFLKKGSKVYLEGQLQTRKWSDQSGAEKYTTEVVLQRFRGDLTILDSKGGSGGGNDNFGGHDDNHALGGGSSSAPMAIDLDDDIPF